MLVILSPAKSLDEQNVAPFPPVGLPPFLVASKRVAAVLKKKAPAQLEALQKISPALAELNYQRNQDWDIDVHYTIEKPAIALFKGDVYLGLHIEDWTAADADFAQNHLRILSGLYGVLQPLDKILPYRLEMGTSMQVGKAPNLVKFWQPMVTDFLNAHPSEVLVDLASQEYSKAVDKKRLNKKVVSVEFKDFKNGKYKVLSFFAKRARGSMARWIVKNRITDLALLSEFEGDGYAFAPHMSTPEQWVFTKG